MYFLLEMCYNIIKLELIVKYIKNGKVVIVMKSREPRKGRIRNNLTNSTLRTGRFEKKVPYQRHVEDWLTKQGLRRILNWASQGLTCAQIAHNMGVSHPLFKKWRDQHPEMQEAVDKGKVVSYELVESALFKRAVGYEYEEEETYTETDKAGVPRVKRKLVKRQALPDISAIQFFLKNRMPSKWREELSAKFALDDDTANTIIGLLKKL